MKKSNCSFNEAVPNQIQKSTSTLFVKNRDLGLICDSLSPVFQRRETASYIITSTGSSFHIYDLDKLDLVFIGPNYDNIYGKVKITAIASIGDITIASLFPTNILSFCDRGKENFKLNLESIKNPTPIIQLESFGSYILALYENGQLLQIDLASKGKLLSCPFNIEIISESFPLADAIPDATALQFLHPSTYLNKILLSTSDHNICIWNFRTKKLIYTLQSMTLLQAKSIVLMVQTPALDIIAVSFSDGFIGFFNTKTDQLLFRLQQPGGAANCVCFRTGLLTFFIWFRCK